MTLTRFAAIAPALVALAMFGTGCKESCHTDPSTGKKVCTLESATQYHGTTTQPVSIPWSSGQGVQITAKGGDTRLDKLASSAIQILDRNAPAGTIVVTFTPIEANGGDQAGADQAQQEMTNDLTYTTQNDGSGVVIGVVRNSTSQSSLSAVIDVSLPPEFDGGIGANAEDGDITIRVGASSVTAKTGVGDVEVESGAGNFDLGTNNGTILLKVQTPLVGNETGAIASGLGDIEVDVPSASNVSFLAQASDDSVVTNNTGGAENDAAPSSKSVTLNGGSTSPWQVVNKNGVNNSILLGLTD